MIVGRSSVRQLACRESCCLLRPALVYPGQAPLGTPTRGAHGLPANEDKNRIRVGRREDARRKPATLPDGHIKVKLAHGSVGDNFLPSRDKPIDDDLHRDLPRIANACAFHTPVRLLVIGECADFPAGHSFKISRRAELHAHRTTLGQTYYAGVRSHIGPVDPQVHQMASTIGNVAFPISNGGHPVRIRYWTAQLSIKSPFTDAGVVDTGEV